MGCTSTGRGVRHSAAAAAAEQQLQRSWLRTPSTGLARHAVSSNDAADALPGQQSARQV
jgi:hypothetical protein